MTTKRTWKKLEQKIAKSFGGVRNPLSGGASRHTRGDVIHEKYYIECKLRAKLSVWEWFRKVEENAKAEGKMPILALKEKSKKGQLVLVRVEDISRLCKNKDEEK